MSFDSNCEFTLTDYTTLATTSDNCGTVTITQSPAVGTVITTTQLITLTADDGNGNTETCTFNVIPADNTKPTITCPSDQNVSFDSNCEFTLTDYTALATTVDNCGIVTVTQSPAVGTVITTTQLITLTADDGNGNTETCTFNVIPADNTKPTITCPEDQNVSYDSNCEFTLTDYTTLATTDDNCGTVTVTQSPAVGTVIITTQLITLTADDGNGNTETCTFNVIPADNSKPSITCPGDQNVSFDSNCEFTLTDYTALATTDDNCGTVTVTQSPAVGTVITTTQLITLIADDGNGNTENCTFNVIPTDNTKPTITCPADQHVSFDANCEFTLTDYTSLATTSDNCGTVSVFQSPAIGTVVTSTQLITLTADDGNGNTETCTFNVIPADNTKPTIQCINDITSCDAIIHFESPTASDNCYVTVELISGIPSGSEFPVGTTVNEYLATDPSGNTASCSVSITRYAPVSIDAGDDTTIDAGFTHTITTTTTEAIEFEWTPTDGLDDPFTQNPTASPQKNTTYTVWAYSENGCSASDDITISINQEMEINNFFSPNGDGKNDYWEVKGNWLLDDCQIKIVDAWGKQVYQSIGYDNSWDGRYNGQSLPEGTYYYTISCSEASVKTGAITLQRVR